MTVRERANMCCVCFQVELEVPQLCSFILKTSQCTLREMFGVDAEGKTLLKKSKNSDDFARAMAQ